MECDYKVSVYITTCNRVDKLKRALKSVQGQTYSNLEIIVCDDASIDETKEFVALESAKDNRIRYFRNECNKGACASRNLAIFNAKGQFITGLDDDDEFTPERIALFLKHWDEKYSFLCCNFMEKYPDKKAKAYYSETGKTQYGTYIDLLFDNIASNQIFTLTERLKEISGFDVRVKRLQDWDTWLRLSYRFGTFKKIPYATYIMHHDHQANEKRVSKSYPLSQALAELKERNVGIYEGNYAKRMDFIVSALKGQAKLKDSIKLSIQLKSFKYFAKYILQFTSYNQRYQ